MLKKSLSTALIILATSIFAGAQSLKYSADGNTLAVDLTINFFDYKTVSQFIFFDAASGKIKSSANVSSSDMEDPKMVFSMNQNLIISDKSDVSTIKMSADNKTEIKEIFEESDNYQKEFIDLGISDDGRMLFKLFSDELKVYNLLSQKALPESGKKISAPDAEITKAEFLAFGQNGQILVELQRKGKELVLIIHNSAVKTAPVKIKLPYDFADDEADFTAQISKNGETLALKCAKRYDNAQITLWDLKTGAALGTFALPSLETEKTDDFYPIKNFAVSPDGRKIAVKINDEYDEQLQNLLVLWDAATKKEKIAEARKYSEEDFAVGIAFSPDSKTCAISSEVLLPNLLSVKIQLLDAGSGKFIREF